MTTTINLTTIKFDTTLTPDLIAYNNLTDNGKKLFNLLNKYAHSQPNKLVTLDIIELSKMIDITPEEFIDGVNEITTQDYFMYYKPREDKYVFANSRMVF